MLFYHSYCLRLCIRGATQSTVWGIISERQDSGKTPGLLMSLSLVIVEKYFTPPPLLDWQFRRTTNSTSHDAESLEQELSILLKLSYILFLCTLIISVAVPCNLLIYAQ